jgi:hypothetical protein
MKEYYQFRLIDSDCDYYCTSYVQGHTDGYTLFEQVIKVEYDQRPRDGNRMGSLEIPTSRVEHIRVQTVGLDLD